MSAAKGRLRIPDEIRDLISHLNPDTKRKVRAALDVVIDDPASGMALSDQLAGYRRIRIAGWRIVYRQVGTVIQIHAVGRRTSVYADLIARIEGSARRRAGGSRAKHT